MRLTNFRIPLVVLALVAVAILISIHNPNPAHSTNVTDTATSPWWDDLTNSFVLSFSEFQQPSAIPWQAPFVANNGGRSNTTRFYYVISGSNALRVWTNPDHYRKDIAETLALSYTDTSGNNHTSQITILKPNQNPPQIAQILTPNAQRVDFDPTVIDILNGLYNEYGSIYGVQYGACLKGHTVGNTTTITGIGSIHLGNETPLGTLTCSKQYVGVLRSRRRGIFAVSAGDVASHVPNTITAIQYNSNKFVTITTANDPIWQYDIKQHYITS